MPALKDDAKAGEGNPCMRSGAPLHCDYCGLPARHRREVPVDLHRGWKSWLLVQGHARHGLVMSRVELVCEHHVKDWKYGPQKPTEAAPCHASSRSNQRR